jgi:ribosomal protein S12 methylthiotransferase accessory factor
MSESAFTQEQRLEVPGLEVTVIGDSPLANTIRGALSEGLFISSGSCRVTVWVSPLPADLVAPSNDEVWLWVRHQRDGVIVTRIHAFTPTTADATDTAHLSPFAVPAAARLVVHEVRRSLEDASHHTSVRLNALSLKAEPYTPSLASRDEVPSRQPFAQLQPRDEVQPGSCRVEAIDPKNPALLRPILEARRALGQGAPIRLESVSVPASFVPIRLMGQLDVSVGRAHDFESADVAAALEALERQSSTYRGQRRIVDGSFTALNALERTLNPEALILPSASDLRHRGQPWQPYRPDLHIHWVHGYSFRHGEAVLVPARNAFLGYDDDPTFVNETSSGTAMGRCLEEAMLHALFEILERDAFLLTWYARRSVARIDTDALEHRTIRHLCDLAHRLGFDIRLYDTTLESGVPSVWVMAVNRGSSGPRTLSSAGAHFDPERAILSGLFEVVASLALLGPKFDAERARACWQNFDLVRDPLDHFQMFGSHEHAHTLNFLDQGEQRDLEHSFAFSRASWRGSNITAKLETLIERLLRHHGDVVFVDQTCPELAASGLHCVRAIVPGTLPMSFGHRERRVWGAERLTTHSSQESETLFSPHPFA